MIGSTRVRFGRALLGAAGALVLAVPLLALPTPARAWWHGGWGWRGGVVVGVAPPPVYYAPPYYAPPPVYYAPPRYYYPPPRRYWVPRHWNGWHWVPGHWA